MSRPPLEVADLIRSAGAAFIERNRQWIRWQHAKVLLAIARCRTAALGGHVDQCTRCGHRATISYNSCRNRHCPKCQTAARDRWIAARQKELLPTRYVHVVFTLPAPLAPLTLQNKKFIYSLLLHASAETLLEVACDPRHLGAEIGFFSVLHTWNQKLGLHPHVHCVIPAGGLSLDHTHWIKSRSRFFLSIKVLRRVFQVRRRSQAGVPQRPTELLWKSGSPRSLSPKPSLLGYGHCSEKIGWSTRSVPSGVRNTCSSISVVTPTALPFPTIVWFPLQKGRSPFAGAIPLITTNRSS